MGVIYILTNTINEKKYVGQTGQKRFKKRFNRHKEQPTAIGNAIRKYGEESFERLILGNVPESELDYWETHYIAECNSLSPNGYNLTVGGCPHKHLSIETRKKMSKARIGIHLSEITKQRIRERRKFQICTEETKARMSESAKKAWEIRKNG